MLLAAAAIAGAVVAARAQSPDSESAKRSPVMARVGGKTITEAEVLWSLPPDLQAGMQRAARNLEDLDRRAVEQIFLERYIRQETEKRGIAREALYRDEIAAQREAFPAGVVAEALRIRQRLYEAKRPALEALIDKRLLGVAAEAEGLTVEQLLDRQVRGAAGRPAQAEVDVVADYELRRQGGARPREEVVREVEAALRAERVEQRRREYLGALRARIPVQVLLEPPRATPAME